MTRRRVQESVEKEARLQEIIAEYQKRQKKSNKISLNRVAKDFNVPRQTLKDRLDGKLPRNKVHEELMHLINEEEKELVHYITILIERDYTPRYRYYIDFYRFIINNIADSFYPIDLFFVLLMVTFFYFYFLFFDDYITFEKVDR